MSVNDADKPFSEMSQDELADWNRILQAHSTFTARKIRSGDYTNSQERESLERWYDEGIAMLREIHKYKK